MSAKQWLRNVFCRLMVIIAIFTLLFITGTTISILFTTSPWSWSSYNFDQWPSFHVQNYSQTLKPFRSDWKYGNDYNVFLEPHLHTTASDGKMTVRQSLQWAQKMGYNAVVVTDHNTDINAKAALELKEKEPEPFKDLIILPGIEYSSCRVHMNLIGKRLLAHCHVGFSIPIRPSYIFGSF
jgi:hypothetical protein